MKVEQLQEGILCSLKMGRWAASKRLDKKMLGKDVEKSIVRAMQDLIEDKTLLKDMATIRRSAKGLLERNSIPFPIDGIQFVPRDKIVMLDESFTKFQTEYNPRLDLFLGAYGKLKKEFKAKFPAYYDEKNYPTKPELRKKFYFRWQFLSVGLPEKGSGILSPKLYKREQEKLQNMAKQMEEMTINIIGNNLFKRVRKLAAQCDSGKINASTHKSVDNFMKNWDTLWEGYVDEKKMRMIMTKLKREMKNCSVERLKSNEDFRQKMQKELETSMSKIKKIPNFKLKRKLDI